MKIPIPFSTLTILFFLATLPSCTYYAALERETEREVRTKKELAEAIGIGAAGGVVGGYLVSNQQAAINIHLRIKLDNRNKLLSALSAEHRKISQLSKFLQLSDSNQRYYQNKLKLRKLEIEIEKLEMEIDFLSSSIASWEDRLERKSHARLFPNKKVEATPANTTNTDSIPNFPWPPPNASAFTKIPSSIFSNRNAKISLMDVADKLEAALDHTGYSQKKYYQIPDGFALVSQLEQFNPDGTSKELPDRWAAEFRPPKIFSLKSYIKAIFTANPGQYRIVAFIVTSTPFEESEETVTREEAVKWLDTGMIVLPQSIGEQPYTDEYYCTALIYEFELPGKGKKAVFKKSSELTGRIHLKKSNLWAALEK
jgi:hypothetical protein